MKYFTILALALLIICDMQVNAEDKKEKDGCKEDCPKELTSVCGYNEKCYQVFDDKCKMEVKNCKDKETFKEAKMDECSKKDNTKCETKE